MLRQSKCLDSYFVRCIILTDINFEQKLLLPCIGEVGRGLKHSDNCQTQRAAKKPVPISREGFIDWAIGRSPQSAIFILYLSVSVKIG
jgi:hypothetical protein